MKDSPMISPLSSRPMISTLSLPFSAIVQRLTGTKCMIPVYDELWGIIMFVNKSFYFL